MAFTLEEVQHIAELARLELTQAEVTHFRQQLSAILDYFVQLQELDASDVPLTSSVLPSQGVLRPDEPRPGLPTGDLLSNASQSTEDQFRVPPVLE